MYKELFKLKRQLDITKYNLKDLALYFESYDGYKCRIVTRDRIIIFKFQASSLPHLIGLQHVFKNCKNVNDYKGITGFNNMKSGLLTYKDILSTINRNNLSYPWQIIKNRIKYFPQFLNTLNSRNTKMKIRDNKLIILNTFIKGNCFIYKNVDKCYPMFSLKEIKNNNYILEIFIVENDLTLLGALKEEKIISIDLISPKSYSLVES